jgi:RNA-binding protein
MIPPVAPKKRSLMPSGKLRRSLRAHGHALSAIVQIGKAGVTDGLVKQLQQALADHELVKVKVAAESPADRFEIAERLAGEPGVNIVQIVGRTILLYKRHPRIARFEGKRAAAAAALASEDGPEPRAAPRPSRERPPSKSRRPPKSRRPARAAGAAAKGRGRSRADRS